MSDAADRTGEVEGPDEPDVGAGACDHDGDLAGLDDAVQIGSGAGEAIGVQAEGDRALVFYSVPLLISTAAIAVIFKNLLDPDFGLGATLNLPILGQA